MELIIFRHTEYETLYNCSKIDIESIPIERRQYVGESLVIIVLCFIYYTLYIPCMFSLWHHQRNNHSYRLLFYIGIVDLSILWVIGFLQGWLSMEGAVYCSHPTLLYIVGCLQQGLWYAESSTDLVLSLNRCTMIVWPRICAELFDGWRIYIWIGICSTYALYIVVFQSPAIFNGIYFNYFMNPFEGYLEDTAGNFVAPLDSYHNIVLAIGSPLIYGIFAIAVYYKINWKLGANKVNTTIAEPFKISRAQMMSFAQIFLISLLNFLGGGLYVAMMLIEMDQWMSTVGFFAWFHIHGFKPVIYLVLNKSVRNDCRRYLVKVLQLCMHNKQQKGKVHAAGVTALVQLPAARTIASNGSWNMHMATTIGLNHVPALTTAVE